MVIELRKRSVLSLDLVIGLVVVVGLIPLAYLLFQGGWAFYASLVFGGVVLPLVGRKFARVVSFDFKSRMVRTVSVLPVFRQSFAFDDIRRVFVIRAKGLGGKTSTENLVVRRRGSVQPIVFEARSDQEAAQARELIEALQQVLPPWALEAEPR